MPELDRRQLLAGVAGTAGVAASARAATPGPGLRAVDLKAAGRSEPLGLGDRRPRLSWRLEGQGARQSAYRIRAASSADALAKGRADVWDSGRIASDDCFDIAWGGPPLRSRQRIFWTVQVWDAVGAASPPSAPASLEAGLLEPQAWSGVWLAAEMPEEKADRLAGVQWIWGENPLEPVRRFRRAFDVPAGATAEFLVSGKDHLKGVWINGALVALPENPAWGVLTPLTAAVKPGRNVIAVEVGADVTGFFPADGGAMAALIRLRLPDGKVRRLVSDASWRTSTAEQPGWTAPDFNDEGWDAAERSRAHVFNEPLPPGPAMLMRRDFKLAAKPVAKARIYAAALGAYQVQVNGQIVSDWKLQPGISVASDHIFHQTYDVTELLAPELNTFAAMVGDGWYASSFGWRMERFGFGPAPRRIRAQLVVTYADGSEEVVATDGDWMTGPSPIVTSEIYGGETFDARLHRLGWGAPHFDASGWWRAERAPDPTARVLPQIAPPVRPLHVLAPKTVSEPAPGVFVFDFGQNFAGWCRLQAHGAPGTAIVMQHAEVLKPSGEVDIANLRHAKARDTFVLRGEAAGERFEPHFTYHGFRYVQVTGYPGRPPAEALTGVSAHTDCPPTGRFEVANPLVQHIWSNALWSQRANFFSQPTDCPQRDERMGWMGDIQVFLDAAAFNMDVCAFIRQFLAEVRAQQGSDGAYPIVTPQPLSYPLVVTAGWSEAGVILPWTLWRRYGDTQVIDENWAAMSRWMAYVGDANPDYVWRHRRGLDLGDWLSVDAVKPDDETTPRALCATAYWAYVADLMAQMAQATGRAEEAARYAGLRARIGAAFAREFVSAEGRCGNDSQTSYVLALKFGLVPAPLRAAAADRLAANIRARGGKLSTGFLGTPYLLDVLADHGHPDVAIGLLLQTQYPSWGYMIRKGATTMWERWNGDVGDVAMNSYDHYAFGSVVGFMYRRLAGIAEAEPGFRTIEVRPLFDPRVGAVRAQYESVVGPITTAVDGDATGLRRLELSVPPNARARVLLPADGSGWRGPGGRLRRSTRGDGLLTQVVGPGRHVFTRGADRA